MKLLVHSVLVIVTAAVAFGGLAGASGQGASAAACGRAIGPFTQDQSEIMQLTGAPYVPYGITVSGLAHQDWRNYTTSDSQEITATADSFWCANTVRLQVGQDNLITSSGVNNTFLTALKAEVTQAEGLGLVVVINDQTEDFGLEPMPTAQTVDFWRVVNGVYGQDPRIVYDIFNEPRLGGWTCWQDATACPPSNPPVTYIGMQELASDIRGLGAKNLLWIEGPHTADTLSAVTSYPINVAPPIAYAIHHPTGPHDALQWNTDFGYLKSDNIPVVVGEWTNYASSKSECWTDAPITVPKFISYLKSNGIGITAWTLKPGVLIQAPYQGMDDPTHIDTSTWHCTDGLDQGAGHQLATFYENQNG